MGDAARDGCEALRAQKRSVHRPRGNCRGDGRLLQRPAEVARAGAGRCRDSARVYAALESNPIYYFRDVEVSVDYGVVQLSGYVWTTDALYRAQEIVRRVPGVTSVQNAMELERQGNRSGGDGTGSG